MAETKSIQGLDPITNLINLSTPAPVQQPNTDVFNKLPLADIKKVIYAECTTAADVAQKVAKLSNFASVPVSQGLQIVVIFTNANTADNISLKLQDSDGNDISGNINIIALGSNLLQLGNGSIKANSRMVLDYDGTYWNAHSDIVSDVNGIVLYANGKTIDSTPTTNSTNLVTSGGIKAAIDTKQNSLTFDNAPTEGSSNPVTSGGVKSAIDSVASTSFSSGLCSTASATQLKEVTIDGAVVSAGALFGITFTNANTYGDTTATTPTYPTLSINGGDAYPICDSRGNYAGTGCWNDGDYIELRFTGTKFCIINSDIRQSVSGTSGYTIYANGNFGMLPYSKTYQASESGTTYTISNLTKYKTISINYTWGGSYNTPGNTSFVLSMVQFVNNGYLTIIDTTNSSYYVTVSLISDTQIKVKGTSSYVYALITLL